MSRHPFDLLMELRTRDIRLDCAALHLGRDHYPERSLTACLRQLDLLAEEVADLRPGLAANLRYEALRTVLVERHNFTGNREHYYDPANSYLQRVLERRVGVPVSLSIVWLEVARRLNWRVHGVALPGHFAVRFDDQERFLLADPFNDGQTLSEEACRRMVSDRYSGDVEFLRSHLRRVGTRGILVRLLRNLRNIYLAQNDLTLVEQMLRRLAAVQPQNTGHIKDLAAICTRQGDVRAACAHLALYLRRRPEGDESVLVRRNLKQLHATLVAQN